MLFGDDWGQQRGLMFGAKRWRQFDQAAGGGHVPQGRRTRAAAVCIHSCGKVQDLFPELIDIGLQVFNPFQPEVMDLREMKARYGDATHLLRRREHPAAAAVRHARSRCGTRCAGSMDDLGPGGGFIIAPSHEMPGDIPLENMLAFIETVQAQ